MVTAGMARRTKNRSSSAYCATRKENPFPSKSSAATPKIPRPLAQVNKASEASVRVTFVGDRGMIKSGQIAELAKVGFHYITAITKPKIETLLKAGILQMALFDSAVCEVAQDGVRYVLRCNPVRAEEIAVSRTDKQARME